ncbi:hypothetical protein L2E82_23108 [Cichorium intybus]|uniref:Uncharacterized protein n=1 Tax=Cichorium intybus TaxID=13427 RepID=A0ACB9DZ92_CICIN|nr:hypothetical protein L2E82_23108 [Cichorium intybus]
MALTFLLCLSPRCPLLHIVFYCRPPPSIFDRNSYRSVHLIDHRFDNWQLLSLSGLFTRVHQVSYVSWSENLPDSHFPGPLCAVQTFDEDLQFTVDMQIYRTNQNSSRISRLEPLDSSAPIGFWLIRIRR